jgi:hypothetical protein
LPVEWDERVFARQRPRHRPPRRHRLALLDQLSVGRGDIAAPRSSSSVVRAVGVHAHDARCGIWPRCSHRHSVRLNTSHRR